MKILLGNDIDRTEWNRLAQNSSTGTWFQTPEAYDFFASMPELFMPFAIGICNLKFETINAQGTLRAICVGYVTVEKNPVKQFFTRRAIIIGGPCISDDCTDEEVIALMSAVKNLPSLQGRVGERLSSPIYIETRNFNDYSRWKGAFSRAGFEYQPHLNFHVDTSSVETVEANLGKSRKRDIKTSIRDGAEKNIFLVEPLQYLPFVYMMERSYLILTDSGGVQEEAPRLGKPVLVMRNTTERPEAVEAGTVLLVGTDRAKIERGVIDLMEKPEVYRKMSEAVNPYGDGLACERIAAFLAR